MSDPKQKLTATDIRAVSGEDRVRELARMLSGLADSDTGQAHARELLEIRGTAPGNRLPNHLLQRQGSGAGTGQNQA